MYTINYITQLGSDLQSWREKGLIEVEWPGPQFFERQGWVFLLQLLAALILVIVILRYRTRLKESERLRCLAMRPVSFGLFFGFIILTPLYGRLQEVWQLLLMVVMCFSFALLISAIIKASWKKRLLYALLVLIILFRLMDVLFLPHSFFRLFTFLTALTGLMVCVWWTVKTRQHKDSFFIILGFYCAALVLVVVVISEIWGQTEISEFMYAPIITSGLLLVVAWLMMYLSSGVLELAVKGSTFQRIKFAKLDTETLLQQLTFLTNVLIGFFILSLILTNLRIYEAPVDAFNGVISLGVNFGSSKITVGLLIVAFAIIVGAYLVSWLVQKTIVGGVLDKKQVSRGVQHAIGRLFHYAIVTVGFLLAFFMLGFELTEFVIIFSALGVGIGFGLQSFVNNFICGLILLFERPVRVGDNIDLGGQWAVIKRIGLRSTTVETFDLANMIIPNNDLINNQVTNWTLSNRIIRLIIPVGVAYGSDVTRVFETLTQCAKENPDVKENPEPVVLFRKFGESSLDFELRVWLSDVDNRLPIASDLHREIDRKFRETGIVIAFPQLDVHLDGTKPAEIKVLSEDFPKDKK
jgi:small-conductance mechanosensitive channel